MELRARHEHRLPLLLPPPDDAGKKLGARAGGVAREGGRASRPLEAAPANKPLMCPL